MRTGLKSFFKKEAVFSTAVCAAAVSAWFVRPNAGYLQYIDTRVLFILFSLMLVVAGLRSCGIFTACADFLCSRVQRLRTLAAVLVFLCFIFSMFITNDVSLLTFVPFAIVLLERCGQNGLIMYVVVLQTVAANLGSMLTPMGNPQNLFLYTRMHVSAVTFCRILLPFVVISAVLLSVSLLAVPSARLPFSVCQSRRYVHRSPIQTGNKGGTGEKIQLAVFWILFGLCISCVMKLIPAWLLAAVTGSVVFIVQRRLLRQVDYMLLLTFCAFFIFTGNIGNIAAIKQFLEGVVRGHEFLMGLGASQIISNVPATLLLYPFSSNLKDLLLGVDIGGLGTLVASLASLISYKLYVNSGSTGTSVFPVRYVCLFTVVNILFMAVLCLYRVFAG